MSCLRTRQMLDGWLDDELDAGTSAELALHIEGCPDCSAARHDREWLRASVQALPRNAAPASLKHAIAAQLRRAHVPARDAPGWRRLPRLPRLWAWWQALALAAASSAAAAVITLLLARSPLPERDAAASLREQLVTRHVASLASQHLIDVASSDRHTVKPWLLGKVDFAPQVRDLAAQGFTLEGARLDQVDGRSAVALVYKLRAHPINVFVWRTGAAEVAERVPESSAARGFSVATWTSGGLRYAAVSDADAVEMNRFAQALLAER